MNEGPPSPDMIPGLRNLIARLEGYAVDDSPEGDYYMIPDRSANTDRLDALAIMLLINDHDEQIAKLESDLSSNQAAVGFLTLLALIQLVALVYMFVR